MFLNQLLEEQKLAFLALCLKLIRSDGVSDPREERSFLAMRQEMGLWQQARLPQGSVEDLARCFTDRQSRRIVMLELLGLVYADGRFSDTERQLLRGLARLFAIDEDEASSLENWAVRQIEQNNQALLLIS